MKKLQTLRYLVPVLILATAMFTSCDKSDGNNNDIIPNDTIPILISDTATNVYAVGYRYHSDGYTIATLWKNGEATDLTDGNSPADAHSVFVDGSDVYVCGQITTSDGKKAVLWKNGESTILSSESASDAYAQDVYVEDGEVYVCYYEVDSTNIAMLWHDGEKIALNDGTHHAWTNKLVVDHGEVYVVTSERNDMEINVGKLWHNGKVTNLSDGLFHCYPKGITVNGGDVHICGYEFNDKNNGVVKYWKNGEVTTLTDGTTNAEAYDILVDNKDVYIGGDKFNNGLARAIYWKNGQEVTFDEYGVIYGIYVAHEPVK